MIRMLITQDEINNGTCKMIRLACTECKLSTHSSNPCKTEVQLQQNEPKGMHEMKL